MHAASLGPGSGARIVEGVVETAEEFEGQLGEQLVVKEALALED